MKISDLPDDCLLYIFTNINQFDDFIVVSSVCTKWRNLVPILFRRIKKLIYDEGVNNNNNHHEELVTSERHLSFLRKVDVSKTFPNLRSLFLKQCESRMASNLCKTAKPLTELVYMGFHPDINDYYEGIAKNCKNLEYLDTRCDELLDFYFIKLNYGHKLRRFNLLNGIHMSNFNRYSSKLINLEQTKIIVDDGTKYNGPILDKLKHLKYNISSTWKDEQKTALEFLLFLPDVQTLRLYFDYRLELSNMEQSKMYNVQELYLRAESLNTATRLQEMYEIFSILSLFPNLERLKIVGRFFLIKEDIIKVIEMHPKLSQFDFSLMTIDQGDCDSLMKVFNEYKKSTERNITLSVSGCNIPWAVDLLDD